MVLEASSPSPSSGTAPVLLTFPPPYLPSPAFLITREFPSPPTPRRSYRTGSVSQIQPRRVASTRSAATGRPRSVFLRTDSFRFEKIVEFCVWSIYFLASKGCLVSLVDELIVLALLLALVNLKLEALGNRVRGSALPCTPSHTAMLKLCPGYMSKTGAKGTSLFPQGR